MLSRLIDLILERGREIYIRETSFLGFPSFHVIIPGMGETFHPMSISETAGLRKTLNGIGDTVKRLGEATDEELRHLAGYIREYCGMDRAFETDGHPGQGIFPVEWRKDRSCTRERVFSFGNDARIT
jgi:hypothetical protein